MNAPKKRRLNAEAPPMSAVAARRAKEDAKTQALKDLQIEKASTKGPKKVTAPVVLDEPTTSKSSLIEVTTPRATRKQKKSLAPYQLDEASTSSTESRAESPKRPPDRPVLLSTFTPSKQLSNFKELKNGGLSIRLAPGERLVLVGQYEMTILKGEATFLGATLVAANKPYTIYAPSSHSLPVIRCLATEVDDAEIVFKQHKSGLESLQSLSPLFGKMWGGGNNPFGIAFEDLLRNKKPTTYQIVFSTEDTTPKTYLQPLVCPPQWNAMLSKLAGLDRKKAPITMICGPKSSGKSTFTRLLTNKLLLSTSSSKKNGVAILDLDPGQPEFSLPGQLSLTHVHEPNFGPPFTHPKTDTENKTIRSHAIAAVSPALDPNLFTTCALNLFAQYQSLLYSLRDHPCPLIINTPGWVLGTGLEILIEMITKIQPTEVIYMSEEGPREVVDSLREAAQSIPMYTLPSQASEYTTRTAAHLRTMQYLSYFHLNPDMSKGLSWNSVPLTSIRPWEVRYCGENSGILGIMCYGEQPAANLLAETINGTLLQVVYIEDIVAIPGWTEEQVKPAANAAQEQDEDFDNGFVSLNAVDEDPEIEMFDTDELHPSTLTQPLIIQTPNEGLPYFNPENAISLDPSKSQALGLALIRGIDIPRKRLQILTSIDTSVIQEINEAGKKIVLISGKLDTPGWAYTEELIQQEWSEKQKRIGGDEEESEDTEDEDEKNPLSTTIDDAFSNTPWVEKLEGSQGRGVGARVWRVRRDLGKSADGGE